MHPKHRMVVPKSARGDPIENDGASSTEGLREQAEREEEIAAFCEDCESEESGTLGVEGDGDITWRCSECGGLHNLSWLDPY